MDILLGICFPMIEFCIVDHNIPLEGRVSTIFDLELNFNFMLKKGNFRSFFRTFLSRLHKKKTRT